MKTLLLSLFVLYSLEANAQNLPFLTTAWIDINNIRASALVHGDLWHNPGDSINVHGCEFPNTSGKNIAYAGGLWLAGYQNGQLHLSAQTFRVDGND